MDRHEKKKRRGVFSKNIWEGASKWATKWKYNSVSDTKKIKESLKLLLLYFKANVSFIAKLPFITKISILAKVSSVA